MFDYQVEFATKIDIPTYWYTCVFFQYSDKNQSKNAQKKHAFHHPKDPCGTTSTSLAEAMTMTRRASVMPPSHVMSWRLQPLQKITKLLPSGYLT